MNRASVYEVMYMKFNMIEEAIEDIKKGKMVILVDDGDQENGGDLTMAAEKVTPEAINFMARRDGDSSAFPSPRSASNISNCP
jgi:hypothetical protein